MKADEEEAEETGEGQGADPEIGAPGLDARTSMARAVIWDCRGLPVLVRGKSGSGQVSQVRICW